MKTENKKYKDSGVDWIGIIPNDWCVEKGKHIFAQRNTKGNESPVLLAATQKSGMIPQSLLEGVVQVKLDTDLQTFKTVHIGDFVISLRSFQGGFEMSDYEGVCSPAYQVFYNTQSIFHKYYKYLFKSYGFISKMNSLVVGIREGKNIQYKDFAESMLPIPPLPTQQRIADFLDRKCAEIDELAALQETMIAELKRYKQSVITEAVTKGLDKNVKFKDSGVEWIGEIPEWWEVIPFKQMYNLGKGLSITKADLVESGVPVISYGQIHSKSNTGTAIKDELIRYVPTSYLENNQDALVKVGDIIFADTSEDLEGCGNCIYIDRDMALFAGYHTIIASNRTDTATRYLSYLFKTDCWRTQIRAVVNGVKLFSIPQKTLAATSIITPPLSEQQAIADYLDEKCSEIDELIAIKQQKIEQLKEYKKSVIFEYVTGKKEVKE